MAVEISSTRKSGSAKRPLWGGLLAALVAMAVGWGGLVYAANNSVQGAKKEVEGGFDGDAPT
ncbi:MAG: D-alanyl-D-alanine carboxypeptidase, partial [Bradyrhizobium sp.]|nr:D-alanyl-D-alanine carboxypeptidase [Bradyrhizobium sp.]